MVSNTKKARAAATPLCFLLFALAVTSLASQVNFGAANPFMHLPIDPHTIVTVLPPQATSTFKTENITLKVTLNLTQWYMTYQGTTTLVGYISSLYYELDGQLMMYTGVLPLASGFSTCSITLNGLSDGRHSLKVYARTSGHYSQSYITDTGIHGYTTANGQVEDSSDLFYFAVYTSKTTTPTQVVGGENPGNNIIKSPLNHGTYSSNLVMLTIKFPTAFSSASDFGSDQYYFMTYSLDGKEAVRIPEVSISYELSHGVTEPNNVTAIVALPALNDGYHTLSVYTREPYILKSGYYFQQGTVDFTMSTATSSPSTAPTTSPTTTVDPTPSTISTPTPPPSPSPTQQPTPEPSQTPDRLEVKDFAAVLIPTGMIFLAAAVVGVLIFVRRRRAD
jgi:hypothetical protein